MEAGNALIFHLHMQSLKQKGKFWFDFELQACSCFPAVLPSFIEDYLIMKDILSSGLYITACH